MTAVCLSIAIGLIFISSSSSSNVIKATVVRVVDGDTIHVLVNGKDVTVRFLEIDTPEIHRPGYPVQCYGPQAASYVASRLPSGTPVTLHDDSKLDKIDRYGRILDYVFVHRVNLNLKLVRLGYAHAYHYRGHRGIYADRIDRAENYARSHKLGFWSPKTCNGDTT